MARIARTVLAGHPHHVTQRGVRSMDIFFDAEDYQIYKELMKASCERFGVKIVAYCLMSNHVHLIVVPQMDYALARAIGEAHRRYTLHINLREGLRGHLFQERFFSTVLDESHFFAALRYVEQNPLRARMVAEAWDYPYSSAPYRMKLVAEDLLLSNYEPIETIGDYREFLQAQNPHIETIRQKTRTGRPCGDDTFYEMINNIIGKDLQPKKAGRKRKNR